MIFQFKRRYLLMFSITSLISAILLGICTITSASAQQAEIQQSEVKQTALHHAIAIYDKKLQRHAAIYTGISYYDPHNGVRGHQFFGDDYWEQGMVNYHNNIYDSIFLKYDIYEDQLIVENFNKNGFLSPIILYKPYVRFFDLMGHHFIRLEKDTISNMKAGYYDQMYSGEELEVLVTRRKEIVNAESINSVLGMFTGKDRYYIKKGDYYYQVRKRKSIVKVLFDRKKEVKTFIRDNNYYFKNNPDLQIVEIVRYYDSLQ